MKTPKPRVAYFSPLRPDPSGIADYSEELLPHLERHWELDLFVDGYRPVTPVARRRRVVDCSREDPVPRLADYDAVLYHIGNSDSHRYIYETLMHWQGLVVLHELSVHHLVASRTIGTGRKDLYLREMRIQHGTEGAERARRALWGGEPPPWDDDPLVYPLNRRVLGQATGVLSHSRFVADAVRSVYPSLLVHHVEHHALPLPRGVVRTERRRRRREPVVFVTAGNLNPTKQVPGVLRALHRLKGRLAFRYELVGAVRPPWEVERFVRDLDLADVVRLRGRVGQRELYRSLLEADVCICLRHPTLGETSGIALRALACGRPLIVNDVGWFSELPDEVALKIPAGTPDTALLAGALTELADDPERCRRMGEAALEWTRGRDLVSRARGYDEFVRAGGLFPKRWLGGVFRSVSGRLDSIDYPHAACAARREATRLIEVLRWNDPPDPRRLLRPPSSLETSPALLAARRRRARRVRADGSPG